MTTNQLRFAELKENKRHNVETESQGRTKLLYDYDIGSRQASAAHRQAGAAETQAYVAGINAATRQEELSQKQYEYETTGKGESQARADNYRAQAELSGARADTESVEAKYRDDILESKLLKDKSSRALDYSAATQNYTKSAKNVVDSVQGGVGIVGNVMTMGMLSPQMTWALPK